MKTLRAKLRVCASCEWVFKTENNDPTCPKCAFGSYGARYVYGNNAHRRLKTQLAWKDKKLNDFSCLLDKEIKAELNVRKIHCKRFLDAKTWTTSNGNNDY